MKLKFKSITKLITKFTPLALFAALGLALAAPQTAQGANYYKFVILGVKTNPSGGSSNIDKQSAISELALYDSDKNRINLDLSKSTATTPSGLSEGSFYISHGDMQKYVGALFNNGWNSAEEKWYVSLSGTQTISSEMPYVVMRLADDANQAAYYNIASADNVGSKIADNRLPAAWKLYYSNKAAPSSDGDWTEIASESLADSALPTADRTWYNGGGSQAIGQNPKAFFEAEAPGPTVPAITSISLSKTEATYKDGGWNTLPDVSVYTASGEITSGYTQTWSPASVTGAGTYEVTVKGDGTTCSGTKTATYTVKKKQVPLPPSSISSNVQIGDANQGDKAGKPLDQDAHLALKTKDSTYYNTWYNTSPYYIRQGSSCQGRDPNTYYPKFVLNSALADNIEWEDKTTEQKQVIWTINETRTPVTLDDNGGSGGQSTVKIQVGKVVPKLDKVPSKADSTFKGYFDAATGGTQYYNANGTRHSDATFPSGVTTLYAQYQSTSGGQWFRLIIKDVKGPTKSHIQLDELALYDVSFNRVNADLVEGSSETGLDFGECAYSGSGTAVADAPVGDLFDGDLDRNHMWAREGVSFSEGSYPTITMHLPSDAAPVTYYNFASGGETANRSGSCAPVSWRLERSTDGENWELFHEQTNAKPVVENDTWLVDGGTENPPQYVIRGDGKKVEWMKPPRQFFRFTVLKTVDGDTGTKTVTPMYIGKLALFDAQGNSIVPTDGDIKKIAKVNTFADLKTKYNLPTVSSSAGSAGSEYLLRLTERETKWYYVNADNTELATVHWYVVTTNETPLAAYDVRTARDMDLEVGNTGVLAWRLETSATGEDDDWQFFDERDFTAEREKATKGYTWYGGGSNPTPAFRPSFLNQVASSPLRTTEPDPHVTSTDKGDIILKDGGDYIHVFTNALHISTFAVSQGSILEVLAVGAGGAGSVGGGNAGGVAVASNLSVSAASSYTIRVGAGGSGNGVASTVSTESGVELSLTANGGTAGDSTGAGGNGVKENGKPMSGNVGGAGGAGVLNAILGWKVTFAGGGGGAGSAGCGAGGLGGGGSQASSDYSSINGEPGLGGGGGGATSGTAGVGGSGLVVIRVKDATGLSSVTLKKTFETWGNEGWNVFPDETVLDGSGAPLTEGEDYTKAWTKDGSPVSVIDNVGVYTLTVTGKPGHSGTLTATYTVNTRYITFKSRSVVTFYTGESQDFPDEECLADTADLAFLTTGYHRNTDVGVYDQNKVIGKFGPNYKINVSPNNGRVAWATGGDTSTEWMTWEIKSETVVIKLDKNGGSTDPDPDEIDVETGVTLKTLGSGQIELPRTGYTFDGYADKDGNRYYYSDGHSDIKYPATGGATKLYALWTAINYPVELRDDTTVLTNVNAHWDEYMPDVEVPKKTGWTFEGYFTEQDGAGVQYYDNKGTGIRKYTDTNVKTLYAKWKADFVVVTLHGNGGTPDSQSVTATPGAAMPTLPAIPTRTGYVFEGYFDAETGGTKYYNADGSSATDYPAEAGPADLYAHWVSRGLIIVVH